MKKNSKPIAFLLTLMLLFTFPVSVFAGTADEGTIGGDSNVIDVTLNVLLPTNLDFALDPLGLGSQDNQVSPADYFFVNMTFAPVKVALDITATASGGAVLVSSPDTLEPDNPAVTDKEIYFAALGAGGVSGEAISVTTTSAVITSSSGIYDYTSSAATRVAFTPSSGGATGSAVIGFALGAATESSTTPDAIEALATSNGGVAVFQFFGSLNTYADWQANDLTVSGAYTLTPLRTTTYSDYTGEFVAGSLNQIEMTPAAPAEPDPVGFIGEVDPTVKSITIASISGTQLVIPFNLGSETVASIKSASGTTVATDQYTVDAVNKTITYSETRTTALKNLTVSTYNTITLSGGGTYTINFVY